MALFNQFGKILGRKGKTAAQPKVVAKEAPKIAERKEKPAEIKDKEIKQIVISGVSKHDIFPRITEKGTFLAERNAYIFNISKNVSKGAVKDAVLSLFKVHPIKVSIVRTKGKKMFARGKKGKTADQKKAYVYLKQGEKIDFI